MILLKRFASGAKGATAIDDARFGSLIAVPCWQPNVGAATA